VLICYRLLAVVTRLQVKRCGVRVPADDRYVSLPQNDHTVAGAHQASFSLSRLQDSFPGVKRNGSEADYLPPFRAEVKSEWSYTPYPPVCLSRVYKDDCTFIC